MKQKLFLFILLLASTFATAQTVRKITGVVTDANNEPLVGVSIMVKGTKQGTITDIDGKFSLDGQSNQTIVASYIGMTTQEAVFTGQPLTIVMTDNSQGLDEVVVVGYGTMRKKDLTGSVVQIRPDRIATENPKTVQDILRGTAGLNVGYTRVRDKISMQRAPIALSFPHAQAMPLACCQRSSRQ